MIPLEVDKILTPYPLRTGGTLSLLVYTLQPGLLILLSPSIMGSPLSFHGAFMLHLNQVWQDVKHLVHHVLKEEVVWF